MYRLLRKVDGIDVESYPLFSALKDKLISSSKQKDLVFSPHTIEEMCFSYFYEVKTYFHGTSRNSVQPG